MQLKIGFVKKMGIELPVMINLKKSCHWLITGSSGSGKSVAVLYWLYSLQKIPELEIWICDFKGSGDFKCLGDRYAEFEKCADLLDEYYQKFCEIKNNRTGKKIILLFDEFASFCIWLESDKSRYKRLQGFIAEILMQGRELSAGGSAWLWTISQRPDSEYYPKGVRENCQVKVCMGSASHEMRRMLNIEKEDIPETYFGDTGTGLLVEDGKQIREIVIPKVSKKELKMLLKYNAAERAGRASLSSSVDTNT